MQGHRQYRYLFGVFYFLILYLLYQFNSLNLLQSQLFNPRRIQLKIQNYQTRRWIRPINYQYQC